MFSHYVYVDFREYEKNKNPVEFNKKMKEVVDGIFKRKK